ncbi:hypothetical protein M422DRAFT_249032 [Sphaerobolus stellatus SS14]|nr:hypothetical protein M422DRAFT_249032 [Sphaerobolus stellatus SS14]
MGPSRLSPYDACPVSASSPLSVMDVDNSGVNDQFRDGVGPHGDTPREGGSGFDVSNLGGNISDNGSTFSMPDYKDKVTIYVVKFLSTVDHINIYYIYDLHAATGGGPTKILIPVEVFCYEERERLHELNIKCLFVK